MTETAKVNIYAKLAMIQQEVKVPKSQYNSFGGYKYRSAEQIESIVKPICMKYGTVLFLSDDISTSHDGWHYVEATATLVDISDEKAISVSAFAREQETKKGMDASQITGTASSYARKYALSGMFLLDDVKDADDDAYQGKEAMSVQYLKELSKFDSELAKHDVDRHDEAVINYVCEKVGRKLNTLDPAVISTDTELSKAVIEVYKGIIAARKKNAKKADSRQG